MPKAALVTGAYGFIGRHLCRALEREGWRVTGVGHGMWSREEWRRWGVDAWHSVDVSLETLITYGRDPDAIFHCAGSGSVEFSVAHPYQDYLRTTHTTASVLEYARLHATSAAVVLLSSAAVYGTAQQVPTPEAAPLAPVSPYGAHKLLAEQLCVSYSYQWALRTAVVRLFSVYGPGLRKQLLWDACNKIRACETSFFGTGEEQRDWLHVSDGVGLLLRAAKRASSACPIVNGGSGQAVTVRSVLELVVEALGSNGAIGFSGEIRRGDPPRLLADTSLAREWGWMPSVDWRSGVREYVAWFEAGAP